MYDIWTRPGWIIIIWVHFFSDSDSKQWFMQRPLNYVNLLEEEEAWRIGIGILKVVRSYLGSYLCRQREESTWNSEACLRSQLAACQALWWCVNPRIAIIMSSWFWLAAKNEHYWSSKPEILALISRPRQDSKLPVSKNHVTQALKAFEYRVVYCSTL